MKQERWEDRLEQHLADYHKEPSRDLWPGIDTALNKALKRQARFAMLRRWMAAAVLVGVVSGGAILFWNRQQDRDMLHPEEQAGTFTQTQVKTVDKAIPLQTEQKKKAIKPRIQPSAETSQLAEERKEDVLHEEHEVQTRLNEPRIEPETSSQDTVVAPQGNDLYLPKAFGRAIRNRHAHLLAINVYVSGGMNNLNSRNGVLMSPQMQETFLSRGQDTESQVWLAGYEERQSHDRPVSFGLTVSYPITDRLAISTGVVYTKLHSDLLTVMQDNGINRHQTLHYVGIPLNLQFTLWRWQRLNVYLSGGGQADWNVKVKTQTDGIDQVMEKDRMQWSLGGGLGVQYDLLPHLGLYAEPGIRHYFDNGSNVSNYFKENPTDFHLEMGLRLKW